MSGYFSRWRNCIWMPFTTKHHSKNHRAMPVNSHLIFLVWIDGRRRVHTFTFDTDIQYDELRHKMPENSRNITMPEIFIDVMQSTYAKHSVFLQRTVLVKYYHAHNQRNGIARYSYTNLSTLTQCYKIILTLLTMGVNHSSHCLRLIGD